MLPRLRDELRDDDDDGFCAVPHDSIVSLVERYVGIFLA